MLCGYIHAFVFTCKLLCSVWTFCLIAFWPVTKVLSCPLRRAKNRKERLVSLSVGKVQLGTYFLHCLLCEAFMFGTQQRS